MSLYYLQTKSSYLSLYLYTYLQLRVKQWALSHRKMDQILRAASPHLHGPPILSRISDDQWLQTVGEVLFELARGKVGDLRDPLDACAQVAGNGRAEHCLGDGWQFHDASLDGELVLV